MFSHLIQTIVRNLLKSKISTAINIIGLSIGLVTVLIIVSYVRLELGYDKFHKSHDIIYKSNRSEQLR
jgi:putative ABC transport system permease protein